MQNLLIFSYKILIKQKFPSVNEVTHPFQKLLVKSKVFHLSIIFLLRTIEVHQKSSKMDEEEV